MAISKRVRFEVFKRDKFTCQYCGRAAPDVVLQVDHIEPRAHGGKNDVINLVTSCAPCNAGKSDKRLSDDSTITKQRDQLAELQERKDQLEMMLQWKRALVDLDAQSVDEAARFWCDMVDWLDITDRGRREIRKWVRKHGLAEVLEAMRISEETYSRYDDSGTVTPESTNFAFGKIGGICRVRAAAVEKPNLQHVLYIRGILRNSLSYVNEREAKALLEEAFDLGGTADELRDVAKNASGWNAWRHDMAEYANILQKGE